MTLSASLIEVRTLSSDQPRSNFNEQQIEEAAKLIVAAEGIINPIIVSRTGINSFQVIDGHFEYHAAARARELNLEIGEAIAAYIIDDQNQAIINQVALFRQSQQSETTESINTKNIDTSNYTSNLETRLTNIESRIENRLNELKSEYTQESKSLKQEIDSLKNRLPEKIEPLATFNKASLIELSSKLRPILGSGTKNEKIAQQIVNKRPFKSLNEVLEKTNGLGDKTMLRIVDSWLYF